MHSNDKESEPEIRAATEKFQRLTGWEAHQWIDILNQPALGFAQTPREAQLISPKKYNNLRCLSFQSSRGNGPLCFCYKPQCCISQCNERWKQQVLSNRIYTRLPTSRRHIFTINLSFILNSTFLVGRFSCGSSAFVTLFKTHYEGPCVLKRWVYDITLPLV